MVRRRGFFRRRSSGRALRRRRSYRRLGAARRRFARGIKPLQIMGRKIGGAFPSWMKPSRITAYTGVTVGLLELVGTNLPDGDGIVPRLIKGYTEYKQTGNAIALLGPDDPTNGTGNNVISIAALQLKQNAAPAIGTMVGFGIGAAILKWVGM